MPPYKKIAYSPRSTISGTGYLRYYICLALIATTSISGVGRRPVPGVDVCCECKELHAAARGGRHPIDVCGGCGEFVHLKCCELSAAKFSLKENCEIVRELLDFGCVKLCSK